MKKSQLIKLIIASLTDSLEVLAKAARASHEEATHESSKAESKYDTRGLEAAYLAGGQARHAKEIQDSIELYRELAPKNFAADEPVDVTALVELEVDRSAALYFIAPKNGGLEIVHRGTEITLLTPQSPLGQILMGKKAGQRWTANVGGSTVKYHLVAVS